MTDQLARTIRHTKNRVPTGWHQFDKFVYLVPKTLVNVFAAPSVGKSLWAINLVHRMSARGELCLYITLDTPLHTQAVRWWALISGRRTQDVVENPVAFMKMANRMDHVGAPVEWCDTPINLEEVPELVNAVAELWDRYPRFIVVDVVSDLLTERTYESYTVAFMELKRLAHTTTSTVVALHHAKKNQKEHKPVYRETVEYAGDKQPDVLIGMHRPTRRTLVAAILKNRLSENSRADGSLTVRFQLDSRARVEEW